ncbi:MAG: erythromycin esterase family protein [Chromatiaceae bacterium]|nr:MAG: erythromycin esterase family protein [Chromatiaceae bacterium]
MQRHPIHPAVLLLGVLLLLAGTACSATNNGLVRGLQEVARPLGDPPALDPLVERLAPARVVLLGEASHGTAEFYTLRATISRALIADHGFRFIAVEGDWNALYRLNRYVKGRAPAADSAREIMQSFDRWPTWMWANEETATLIEWLKGHNAGLPPEQRVGFYGIDVYGKADALRELPQAVDHLHPGQADWLRGQYAPFAGMVEDLRGYVHARQRGEPGLSANARAVVERLREARDDLTSDAAEYLHLKQMAWVVKNAERHYSGMASDGPDAWNARVEHFWQTLQRLLEFYGPDARGIVWAHNTHIGDARATSMAARGQRNIGQLAREGLDPGAVAAVGFGTHRGSVLAGRAWAAPLERMRVPPAAPGSIEAAMHEAGPGDLLFLFDAGTPAVLRHPYGHRAIGVVYHPEREVPGNYVDTVLPQRYDAFLFIEETTALTPLH